MRCTPFQSRTSFVLISSCLSFTIVLCNMNNFTERKPFVSYLSNNEIRFAEKFAARHDLEFIKPRNLRISKTHKQVIWASSESLLLQDLSIKNSKPFMIDYLSFKKIKAKSSLLKKCFSKKDSGGKVLDLTAGFCIDAPTLRNKFFPFCFFHLLLRLLRLHLHFLLIVQTIV